MDATQPTSPRSSATATSSSSAPSGPTCSTPSAPSWRPTSTAADSYRGRNDFEGFETNRVYGLLAKSPTEAELVTHPRVLAILDALLLPGYLLSANLAINLLPGETAQDIHFDDTSTRVPRPRPAIGVSAIWAIDDFTAANGATEVIPGSHRWGDGPPPADVELVAVEMPAGSVVVFAGHPARTAAAPTRPTGPRLAITPQYCEPWARQQENMMIVAGDAAAATTRRCCSR